MIFKIVTLFPEFFKSPFETGLLGKAIESGIISTEIIDIRKFTEDKYNRCDDYPYGGGSGMVLMPEPLTKAIEYAKGEGEKVVFTSASGVLLKQDLVKDLSRERKICFVCGHYEGIDQRVIDKYADYEISIGDYVLSGGEFSSLIVIDAIARYLPGFMSNIDSLLEESFEGDLLEYPHYTRPAEIFGLKVPEILLSGNHRRIEEWRYKRRVEKTKLVRPDLYKKFLLRKLIGE